MKIIVFGATGGTGRELVTQALTSGHTVTAFVRNPDALQIEHPHLAVVQGNVLDADSVDRAVKGHDAVLCALGHKRWFVPSKILSQGTQNIVASMKKHDVRRIVCETALGIGDTRGKLGLYYSLFVVPVIVFFYFRDKETQERVIKESGLEWIIVRPGQLTNGKRRGAYRSGPDVGNWITTVHISRADVAEFMLSQLTSDEHLRQTPSIAY